MQLLSVLTLASIAIAAPAATSNSCTNPSVQDIEFAITDFNFAGQAKYSTPAHLATSEAKVSFDVVLSGKPRITISCSATTDETYPTYFDGKTSYPCNGTNTASASFRYMYETQRLTVSAEWYCPAQGWVPSSFRLNLNDVLVAKIFDRSRFDATGHGKAADSSSCDSHTKKNPNWTPSSGGIYETISETCATGELTIIPSEVSGVA